MSTPTPDQTPPDGPETPAGPPPKQRGNPSLGDMVRSVLVVGLIVVAALGLTAYLRTEPEDPADRSVEYAATAATAAEAAPFDLLSPTSLPEGWRSNGARYDPGAVPSWHLGVLTEDDEYIGLEQSTRPADEMVEEFSPGTSADGTVTAGGETWQLRTDDTETTLVRTVEDATTLVTGTADEQTIADYVATLQAPAPVADPTADPSGIVTF